ncbi:MAG: preprotein translocase subunit SecA, partial [Campylobacterota bacterium]|nr:preprotein translocase subunit SecA [Campylobacterota bacterium]
DNLLRIFGSDKIKSIMERLGVQDGEYIESKMVTRAVEKAQKKVENMHYEGRKHIVEYDDVANEQRKIVYKFRNQLLDPDFDIASKIDELRAEYITHILSLADIFDGGAREEFNLEKAFKILYEEIHLLLDPKDFALLDYDELLEAMKDSVRKSYEEKMSVVTASVRNDIEREIYLKELDSAWREHLYAMDNMKTGIRLRAYNQKDPLVEYKKESFNLFGELIADIKFNTIKTLQIIQFKVHDPEEEAKRVAQQLEAQRKIQEAAMQFNRQLEEEANDSNATKVSRNDLCPCGSGKKYKLCCGKSGPKKGVFAS